MHTRIILLNILLFFVSPVFTQEIQPSLLQKSWEALWISTPDADARDYSIQYFRKEFPIDVIPNKFIVHVSADNRYKLFVNGQFVSTGPARGELYHWNFETVDLAPFFKQGNNIISTIVWNYGEESPEAQISLRTAFILQGDGKNEAILNTNKTWLSYKDKSYKPLKPELIYTYYAAGPGEQIDFRLYPSGWTDNNYDSREWKPAQELFNGLPKGVFGWTNGWMLIPRKIPMMELKKQNFHHIARNEGIDLPAGFPEKKAPVIIEAHKKITFILDQNELTNAYPVLSFSKGKDAVINIGYAEALFIDEGSQKDWRSQNKKGNRNETKGKRFVGVIDKLIASGRENEIFTSLTYRTFRYLQMEIETAGEALIIEDLYSVFTGYPFSFNASFETGNDTLNKILKTGWHTARLCAMETYMDCPYYEQLQYVGDTRIQALVSLFNSGDDLLMRNAIIQLDQSRMAEGITLSRYPTRNSQQIPPFSLWWIGMLHDYWLYRPDSNFVKEHLPGMRQVLWFFSKYQDAEGHLKNLPYWNFTDWCESEGWNGGVAPISKKGFSAALDLQLLWAFQLAAELEKKIGSPSKAKEYSQSAEKLKASIRSKYWYAAGEIFADTEEKNIFSQHVNTLSILTKTATPKETVSIAQSLLSNKKLSPATIYFKYYLHQALISAGLGNNYLDWLDNWKENLQMGMTTWAEISDINAARSDCHAWGSSPNIEFFRTVLGINSDAPGFKKIRIEPMPGKVTDLKGHMPHPAGTIKVEYLIKGNAMNASIELPIATSGSFVWKQKHYPLNPGRNTIKIPQ